ncbi:MAG: 7-carboxy-7-deazaguanine synthase QueE [Planctomycetota bacterium]
MPDGTVATLPIAETFRSIQGEGVLVGVPSFFIRVSGCNLRCGWCDTPYASWSPEGRARSIDELAAEATASGVGHVVLTGGEPMLFDAIEPLSGQLRARGMHITIETAGTIHRGPDRLACDLMSLSPKLASSAPSADDPRDPDGRWRARHEATRHDLAPVQRLIDDYLARQLKFVVTSPADLDEIDEVLDRLTSWSPSEVLLMPEGVVAPAPGQHDWVIDACAHRGWRYCPRVHITLFGNTRGT